MAKLREQTYATLLTAETNTSKAVIIINTPFKYLSQLIVKA